MVKWFKPTPFEIALAKLIDEIRLSLRAFVRLFVKFDSKMEKIIMLIFWLIWITIGLVKLFGIIRGF